jgi:hypothetical protein
MGVPVADGRGRCGAGAAALSRRPRWPGREVRDLPLGTPRRYARSWDAGWVNFQQEAPDAAGRRREGGGRNKYM